MSQFITDDFVRGLKPTDKRIAIFWDTDAPGCPGTGVAGFGIRITSTGCRTFIFYYRTRDTVRHQTKIGRWPSFNVERARKRATRLRTEVEDGGDPQATKVAERNAAKPVKPSRLGPEMTLHDSVANKFAYFFQNGIEPSGYLYRHYDPNGDLLYIGITQSIRERTKTHLSKATWKEFICLIIVEPFETREELLEAERAAILNEFPKFNQILNGHRHPVQELAKRLAPSRKPKLTRRQANDQRYRNVLARRAADALSDTTEPQDAREKPVGN